MITGPELFDQIKPLFEKLNSDPKVKLEYEMIIADKKEEWRARESNRKLVG